MSPNPAVESVKSNDSDKTLSGSSDSIGTAYRMDSQVRAPPWAPLTPAPGLDHLGGGGRPQHLELRPPDVHQGVGHSLRGTQVRFQIICSTFFMFLLGTYSFTSYCCPQVGGQDWLRSVLHGACRQLARRCGHQVPGYGGPNITNTHHLLVICTLIIFVMILYKYFYLQNLDDENTLEAFRLDVATFR